MDHYGLEFIAINNVLNNDKNSTLFLSCRKVFAGAVLTHLFMKYRKQGGATSAVGLGSTYADLSPLAK